MRVYLDNVAASGRVLGDLEPASERKALEEIEHAHSTGRIKIVTSRESWREQDRTKDVAKHAKLAAARAEVSVVATDHVVLGSGTLNDLRGTTMTYPLVSDIVDDALFCDLKKIGRRAHGPQDARGRAEVPTRFRSRLLRRAGHERRDLLLRALDRRSALEARCSNLKIVKPSELAAELRNAPHGGLPSKH